MHVAEVLSSERAVPAIATVVVHVALLYVVAMSAGIVPKPDVLKESTYVPLEPRKETQIQEAPLISDDVPVITQRFDFPRTIPDDPIVDETPTDRTIERLVPVVKDRPDGEGVSIPTTGARIVYKTEPPYPNYSRLNHEEGVVLLRITINEMGSIGSVSVERSSGFARLDEAALKAIRQWRFAPAMRGSQAIATTTTVPVRFRLN